MIWYSFKGKIWKYPGSGGWHFVTLPKTLSSKIRKSYSGFTRGWGSIRVETTIGLSKWKTSIFPDSKSKSFLLPVKAAVRKKENLKGSQSVKIRLDLLISHQVKDPG